MMEYAACNRLKMSQSSLKACSHISISHNALAKFMEHRKYFSTWQTSTPCPLPYLVHVSVNALILF